MQIEQIKVDGLTPYARNSRTHSTEQINQVAASIQEFGFTNPILIDKDGGIIAGHGRVMAAKQLGMDHLPCIRLDHLTDAQKRAYVIADNKLALNSGWDEELLALEIDALKTLDFDLELLGFESKELDVFLLDSESGAGLTDPDEAPPVPEQPTTQRGDVWLLGPHRVMCGSSTDQQKCEILTEGNMVDILITDPPYNVAYEGKTKDRLTIENDRMSDSGFFDFLCSFYKSAVSVLRPGGSFYVWHADSEGHNFRHAAIAAGLNVRQCLVWVKNSLVLGRQDYHWQHEPCLYGWKDGAAHSWYSDRKQTTILAFNRPTKNREHPTMKPVDLIEYQIKNSSERGQIVLDLFLGSGTTLIAAEKNGRICYGMELDPKYCDVIVNRWQNFTGQLATLDHDGRTFAEIKADRMA